MGSKFFAKILYGFVAFFSVTAFGANSGRSLPRGEDIPLIVQSVFLSPVGEVQILRTSDGGFTAWLRTEEGALLPFREMIGSTSCSAWLGKGASGKAPKSGCEFLFLSEANEPVRVKTTELKDSSLFELARPGKRGMNVPL